MKLSRTSIAIIVASTTVAMAVICANYEKAMNFARLLQVRNGSDVLVSEDGTRLTSLFQGRTPPRGQAHARLGVHPGGDCSERTGASRGLLDGVLGPILDPPVAHAQNCVPSICAGAYYTYEWHECPPACFGWYKWHYSDPTVAPANAGWRYNGREGCLWCGGCEEESCFTS